MNAATGASDAWQRSSAAGGAPAGDGSSARLERLRRAPRAPGEASFFFWDAQFRREAVKVLPGEYFVCDEDLPVMTVLGSCIAACLWDRSARIGGMNHFMLPDGGSGSGRYGAYAMELLVNGLLKRGASRLALEAKVFGGGQVIGGMETLNVGERNTRFALEYLRTERIPVLAQDVLDVHPRKVCFLPASGRALVKRLVVARADDWVARDRAAADALPVSAGGSVDLF